MLTATKGGKINISEEKDTKSVAERFSKLIKQGDFILLSGNLGVGKTTFIKYVINSLQKANKQKISEVTSPTFTVINEYQIKKILIDGKKFGFKTLKVYITSEPTVHPDFNFIMKFSEHKKNVFLMH